MRWRLLLGVWLVVGMRIAAQDKEPAEELPAKLVAAWVKSGQKAGWMGPNPKLAGSLGFSPKREDLVAAQTIPAFELRFPDKRLSKLPAPAQPFGLYANGGTMTDRGVTPLIRFKHLSSLALLNTAVTDGGLKQIATMKQLRSLDLAATKGVTQRGLRDLAALKQLESLDLTDTFLPDAAVKEVGNMKQLTNLSLFNTKVTDVGLKDVARLEKLAVLNLGKTRVTDGGLKELAPLEGLTLLDLRQTPVTDAGLKALAGMTKLATLDLAGTKVTDDGIKALAEMKTLTSLILRDTQVTRKGLQELKKALPGCKIDHVPRR